MIRIDLLPSEFRRAERTPAGVLFATMGLAAVVTATAAAGACAWFGIVGSARADVEVAQETFESKVAMTTYADKLEAEKKEYSARLEHIKAFGDSRILWTKKLDQLASLIDAPAEESRHTVWLEQLLMHMDDGRTQGVKLSGKSATAEVRRLSNFHRDLAGGPFFSDFTGISNPAGKVVNESDFEPADSWEFEFALNLDAPEQKPGAKKPAPAAKK